MAERYSTDEVQALADEFIRFKRYVEDALENLDVNNFSDGAWKKMVAKFGDVSSAGFEAYADAKQAVARMFAEYSKDFNKSLAEIRTQANSNRAEVQLIAKWKSDNEENISSIAGIKETVDDTASRMQAVTQLYYEAAKNISSIDGRVTDVEGTVNNFSSISSKADISGAFIELIAHSGNTNIDITKGYTKDDEGNYIFYDSDEEPITLSESDFAGIYINALNGSTTEIKLNADVIKLGQSASVDENGNMVIEKLFSDSDRNEIITVDGVDYPGRFYAQVDSWADTKNGDFGGDFYVKAVIPPDGSSGKTFIPMYGFEFGQSVEKDVNGNIVKNPDFSINFVVTDNNGGVKPIWGYSLADKTNETTTGFWAKGDIWHFDKVKVTGLGVVPVFGE